MEGLLSFVSENFRLCGETIVNNLPQEESSPKPNNIAQDQFKNLMDIFFLVLPYSIWEKLLKSINENFL